MLDQNMNTVYFDRFGLKQTINRQFSRVVMKIAVLWAQFTLCIYIRITISKAGSTLLLAPCCFE